MKKVIISVAAFFTAVSLYAASVTVGWTPNSETNIFGYRVLYGSKTGVYTNSVTVTNSLQSLSVTNIAGTNYTNIVIQTHASQTTITGLPLGFTNFFNIVAYNTAGQTGPLGGEVTAIIFPAAPTRPTVVQNFKVLSVSPSN
jgi:hypothetical protein